MPSFSISGPEPSPSRGGRARRGRRAFTLIELLVVIAIISILASILMPAFASARERARQTACLSNTKQLGEAFMMYSQDYDEGFPGSAPRQNIPVCGGVPTDGWVMSEAIDTTVSRTCSQQQLPARNGSIWPYVKNERIYVCPSDVDGDDRTLSYAMNSRLSDQGLAFVGDPSSCILLIDQQNGKSVAKDDPNKVGLDDGEFLVPTASQPSGVAEFYARNDQPTSRHLNGGVMAYVDGHSKWARPDQLKISNFDPAFQN